MNANKKRFKLNQCEVINILRMFKHGLSTQDISERVGMTRDALSHIIRGTAYLKWTMLPSQNSKQNLLYIKDTDHVKKLAENFLRKYLKQIIVEFIAGRDAKDISMSIDVSVFYVVSVLNGSLFAGAITSSELNQTDYPQYIKDNADEVLRSVEAYLSTYPIHTFETNVVESNGIKAEHTSSIVGVGGDIVDDGLKAFMVSEQTSAECSDIPNTISYLDACFGMSEEAKEVSGMLRDVVESLELHTKEGSSGYKLLKAGDMIDGFTSMVRDGIPSIITFLNSLQETDKMSDSADAVLVTNDTQDILSSRDNASDEQIEKVLQELQLNAPRLTPELVESVIVNETYTVLESGKCMICELTLKNGFTVRGESSCVSKENFNVSVGMKVSRDNAKDKIWGFEAYLLQQKLYEDARLKASNE